MAKSVPESSKSQRMRVIIARARMLFIQDVIERGTALRADMVGNGMRGWWNPYD